MLLVTFSLWNFTLLYFAVANLVCLGIVVPVFSQAPLLVVDDSWSHNSPIYRRTVAHN